MVFSNSTTEAGIIEEIDFLLNLDSNTTYPIKDKTRSVNRYYNRVVSLIFQADGRFEFDDNNQTDLPIGTTALVANQQDYSISGATFLKILRVEVKNSNGDWTQLKQISLQDKKGTAMTEYRSTAGVPVEYDVLAQSVFLYPKPNYSASASLKIYYQRDVSLFVSTDTTKVPGFAAPFHNILSFGAALDYAIANNLTSRIPLFREEIAKLEQAIIEFYGNRDKDSKLRMTILNEDYGQGDIMGLGNVDIN